jgi:hypothetical protein
LPRQNAVDRTDPKRWVKTMKENEVISLVRGLAPRIREIVADAITLPPELAEEVAKAVRLLHESPPIEQRNETPQALPSKVIRIERDDKGNLVPIYDETQS